jgi:DNA-3-methyladenine glycosylase I
MLKTRCAWVGADPLSIAYHDQEWGVPLHDDQRLFEFLVLEGAQAGLNWMTILKKRDNFRRAFEDFDPLRVAQFDEARVQELLQNPGIVRNRRKIEAAISNAQALLEVRSEFGSFDAYVWGFVKGQPLQNYWRSLSELPAQTVESQALSRDLKKRGFSFVGPTICYAFMQAVGMVNDHTVDCHRHAELSS